MLSLITASCHKSTMGGAGNPAALSGNYKFIYISYNTQISSVGVGAGETTSSIGYFTYTNSASGVSVMALLRQ